MGNSIHILPDEVASQIAAGEVVERPYSVVKELIENSIDAGATHIQIQIKKAGQELIEVIDDGIGIPADELALALTRHATSKLNTAKDLFKIHTLGFRGEALASIASVSQFTITSRVESSEEGARIKCDGGHTVYFEKTSSPVGTFIKVENLFFNVPARLKFLKRDSTEKQQIDTLISRYCLAYAHIRFQYIYDGNVIIQTSGNGDRREALTSIYGVDLARQLLEVNFEEDEYVIAGYISPISLTRSNRKEITFFINGRWVQDTSLSAAIMQAYHTLLMIGRYPLSVLFIRLPTEDVDVNVHPAKSEVRFKNSEFIFSRIQRAVKRALLAHSTTPGVYSPHWPVAQANAPAVEISWELGHEAQMPALKTEEAGQFSQAPGQSLTNQEASDSLPGGGIPLLRLIGQLGATYLVAEGPDGLYLVDQHAAHERILFEKMLRMHSKSSIPSQTLLEGSVFQLPPQNATRLGQQIPFLKEIGFQVESFGPHTFRVTAIPAFFSEIDPVAAVRVIVEDFEEDETPLQAELERRMIARICKRMAVKGGQVLSHEEQVNLIRDLEACQSPRTCPHGRPTMIHLSVDVLERQFGRRGSR